MDPLAELAKLRQVYPAAELWDEGGQPLVFIPNLWFRSAGAFIKTDGLLCPRQHSSGSYPTRLFLRQQVPNKGQNWAHHVIRGMSDWHSPSYDGVAASMPWIEILATHLRGYL